MSGALALGSTSRWQFVFVFAAYYVEVKILSISILNDLHTGKAPGKQESYFILRIVFLSSRKTIFGLNPIALLS